MGIITPEVGAISNYLWVTAQEGIKSALETISTAQTIINPDYEFKVETNLYRPSIEDIEDTALVNILVGPVGSDGNNTDFSKNHIVTYYIDCYVRGKNEDHGDVSLVPADEVAVQRLQYLCAMVEYGLTSLANYYQGLGSGQIYPDKINLIFNQVDDVDESVTPYAPARFEFVCIFPYTPQDLTGLPDLAQSLIDLDVWASKFVK